ncbi:hypothetical protein ACQP1O_25060 [Nocardia sp. CA-151230]|uniref:hypothetical protein n=1 Tax=Nocardia sp. CA-151230 TaxID=3239982 RepID=UPI003D8E6F15
MKGTRPSPIRPRAGAQYTLTGPEAITVADTAAIISGVSSAPVTHPDIDRDEWIAAAIAGGIPAEYTSVLRMLTENHRIRAWFTAHR